MTVGAGRARYPARYPIPAHVRAGIMACLSDTSWTSSRAVYESYGIGSIQTLRNNLRDLCAEGAVERRPGGIRLGQVRYVFRRIAAQPGGQDEAQAG